MTVVLDGRIGPTTVAFSTTKIDRLMVVRDARIDPLIGLHGILQDLDPSVRRQA